MLLRFAHSPTSKFLPQADSPGHASSHVGGCGGVSRVRGVKCRDNGVLGLQQHVRRRARGRVHGQHPISPKAYSEKTLHGSCGSIKASGFGRRIKRKREQLKRRAWPLRTVG